MKRETEIDIAGDEVSVSYSVNEFGRIHGLEFINKGIAWPCENMLEIDSVYDALQAHHTNLLIEDNAGGD